MYFFYVDESGNRDPSLGTDNKPKDHLYVLLAIGMYEGKWQKFDRSISNIKLELADYLQHSGKGTFNLSDCEIKSNWIRNPKEREAKSLFLHLLDNNDRERLVATFFEQIEECNIVAIACVVDKRHLHEHMTNEILHKKAYEFLLERIEHCMAEHYPKHRALIVMDDTGKALNQAITLKHAFFQRAGNSNMRFKHIVEYPFFTRSELSNGVQLADLLAYSVYKAFRYEDFDYPYFKTILPRIYKRQSGIILDGLKVWPEGSPLIDKAKKVWQEYGSKKPSKTSAC